MSTPPPDPTMAALSRGILLRPATPPAAEAAASQHVRYHQSRHRPRQEQRPSAVADAAPAAVHLPPLPHFITTDSYQNFMIKSMMHQEEQQPPPAAFWPQPDALAASLARSLGPNNTRQLIGLLQEEVEQAEERQRKEELMKMREAGGFRMTHWEPVKTEKPTPSSIRAARRRRREQMSQQRLLQLQQHQLQLLRQKQQSRTDEDESML